MLPGELVGASGERHAVRRRPNAEDFAAETDHATTLRAFRRPAGGTAELAGTSATTTVSLTEIGPLTSGVTYEFWLVGHNSQGDGPQSNHVSHLAT